VALERNNQYFHLPNIRLIFMMAAHCVLCAVRTDHLCVIQINFSVQSVHINYGFWIILLCQTDIFPNFRSSLLLRSSVLK